MISIDICAADDVQEGGKGIRFPLTAGSDDATGFVVRYGGQVHAYLNRCAHVPIELDWNPGEFFEGSGLYIMCSTHGAIYEPASGHCSGGPCRGSRLRKIAVTETDSRIVWHPDDYLQAVIA
ncbi:MULTISPECIES: Rieske (2Fe-2S) protein [unclassified Undibacterium]|uniref:Rieske (2Fe-2S) protein n=1 Tax=unclassified Undibacterium TaxID=2630295 RepID=UPI002AC9DB17|nr:MULTISPECIES: Rieske (2Fe-2S) protein [unclassified Undibacterium]MEB0138716.1 Rieske (2Fe-2S) protein [Undibacterium sp. CCC2.1]MEB0171517.1 Rieske (2Fe-2S) protein [Undibacterium sp. CCC1.1]MEB0175412.1 Rieske (2Fe-2S) protein [Undibacterium sp. CCC3.4]MEB0214717.1 Rieske (2Fe-2S) protein [Undibacterium sp. 5I2]WPX43324.1 Rieske (2Fe-2S) protein [Undibacterium sp. CCC3.4]